MAVRRRKCASKASFNRKHPRKANGQFKRKSGSSCRRIVRRRVTHRRCCY